MSSYGPGGNGPSDGNGSGNPGDSGSQPPHSVSRHFPDGSTRFRPQHSKEEAAYREAGSSRFDPEHGRCGSCVHYIPGGGCHFVEGEIDPEDYCEEFYADIGVFAHQHSDRFDINAVLEGDNWEASPEAVTDFVEAIEDRLEHAGDGGGRGHSLASELLDLSDSEKRRRLSSARDSDEWPGTWEVFESQASFLPSWRNDEGKTIRMVEERSGEPYGFVHLGGTEDWRGLTYPELHDVFVDYMADHPGG